MIASLALLFSALAAPASQPPIVQSSTGWCSPNFANVGKVTVKCIGVDPQALIELNIELNRQTKKLDEQLRLAEDWARRYAALKAQLEAQAIPKSSAARALQLLRAGKLDEAEQLVTQSIRHISELRQKSLERIAQLNALEAPEEFTLAQLNELQFKLPDARQHYESAVKLAPAEPEYSSALAHLLLRLKEYKQAEEIYSDVLQKLELPSGASGKSAELLPRVHQDYAWLLMETDRPKQAEDQFMKALTGFLELAKANPTARNVNGIAGATLGVSAAFARFTDPSVAAEDLKAAIGLLEFVGKPNDPGYELLTANARLRLGVLYVSSQHFEEAEEQFQQVLAELQNRSNSHTPEVLELEMTCLDGLGVVYDDTDRETPATFAFVKASAIAEDLWKTSPEAYGKEVVVTLSDTAEFFRRRQRTSDAEQAFLQLNQKLTAMVSLDPAVFQPRLAESLVELAQIRQNATPAETIGYLETALPILETPSSRADPHLRRLLVETLTMLGNAYRNTKPPAVAEATLVRAREEAQGLDGSDKGKFNLLATASANLGLFYLEQGDAKKAQEPIENAYSLYRDLQRGNPAGFGDNLAKAALLLAFIRQDSAGAPDCGLLKEAAAAAISSDVKQDLATRTAKCQP